APERILTKPVTEEKYIWPGPPATRSSIPSPSMSPRTATDWPKYWFVLSPYVRQIVSCASPVAPAAVNAPTNMRRATIRGVIPSSMTRLLGPDPCSSCGGREVIAARTGRQTSPTRSLRGERFDPAREQLPVRVERQRLEVDRVRAEAGRQVAGEARAARRVELSEDERREGRRPVDSAEHEDVRRERHDLADRERDRLVGDGDSRHRIDPEPVAGPDRDVAARSHERGQGRSEEEIGHP